ncbi:MAG: GIY-YIG nuclease family protein [Pseudomonadota bacterium]
MTANAPHDAWWVYLVGCGDRSIYVGVACDVARRIAEHRDAGARAARYLRGRGPLRLLAARPVGERGDALSVEYQLKQLPAARKRALTVKPEDLDQLIASALAKRAED